MRTLPRRSIIAGLVGLALVGPVLALEGEKFGLKPGASEDQSAALQTAMLEAASQGAALHLAAGAYAVGNIQIPSGLVCSGVPGATILMASGDGPVARISGSAGVRLSNLVFAAGTGSPSGEDRGLLEIEASADIHLESLSFKGGKANGLAIHDAAVDVSGCSFSDHGMAAIYALDSRGLTLIGNRISKCSNAGIRLWGSALHRDGSVISGNDISAIGTAAGGNGQNGNGISLFRVSDVAVSANRIADCAFTAIRLNATGDVTVTGNVCRNSGEVAIFSEFGFSGSVIADNVIDGAATGISVTNLDSGGRLATVSGNVVRNIAASSKVNPDTRPVGIYVEAATTVTGNSVDTVPGIGILAGHGPFLADVVISQNVVAGAETGIAASTVRESQTGGAVISGNLISGSKTALSGRAWDKITSTDLVADAAQFPNLLVSGNLIR